MKIVITSGGYDPVRKGHMRLFKDAWKMGDVHVAILNDNSFLIRKKGYEFLDDIEERKELLEGIKYINRVVVSIDKDDSVCETLRKIAMEYRTYSPDCKIIFANGGDRRVKEEIREAKVCDELGIELVFNVGGGKISSSSQAVNRTIDKLIDLGKIKRVEVQ